MIKTTIRMQIEYIYISLIIRYLKKDISVTEQQKLFNWVYSSSENEKLFYSLKDIWETARYEQTVLNASTDEEWEKFALEAINSQTEKHVNKKFASKQIYRIIQIAAIVIITFGIGFFVKSYLPEKVTYASVNVPYGAKSELNLPDGSKIWVNSGSNLRYPSNMDGKQIDLYLEGEAFFDITKNPNRKLNVKTSNLNIQVLGTRFNIKSYNEENLVETTLLSGSISITGKVGGRVIKDPIILSPNEQAVLNKTDTRLTHAKKQKQNVESLEAKQNSVPEKIKDQKESMFIPTLKVKEGIDTESFVSWKDNKMVFKAESFENLAKKMERWYNVKINIKDDELKKARYTGRFDNETVEQAVEALSISLPFTYKIEKNQIEIIKRKTN